MIHPIANRESSSTILFYSKTHKNLIYRYIRQARGYQGLGEFDKAMDTLARALTREDLKHDTDLAKSLIVLQTDGKGLPQNEEDMEEWKQKVLAGDVASAKRMKEVPVDGAWYAKLAEHSTTTSKPMEL